MRKNILIFITLGLSFVSGFAFKSYISNKGNSSGAPIKKVTGLGGVFFKCKDPVKLREWYQQHLGISNDKYGAVFEWWQGADSSKKGFTQWSPFSEKTKYFLPSQKDFMINYRVADIGALVKELKQNGVNVLDTIETYDYGKFAHILDLEGNKLELWQANDLEYEKMGKTLGSKTVK